MHVTVVWLGSMYFVACCEIEKNYILVNLRTLCVGVCLIWQSVFKPANELARLV